MWHVVYSFKNQIERQKRLVGYIICKKKGATEKVRSESCENTSVTDGGRSQERKNLWAPEVGEFTLERKVISSQKPENDKTMKTSMS